MDIKVIDFRREKQKDSLFVGVLKDPTFCVLISEDGKAREISIQIRGEFPFLAPIDTSFYNEEAYRNYKILEEFLLSDKGLEFINRIDVDEDIFIMGLYKVLVNRYSHFGWFRKKLLIILEYLNYYSGKLGRL